jgi:lipopolysaccharide transport system ATP-binding protein
MPTAIKFENISKQYRLGLVSTRTISHDLNRWWQTSILKKEDPYLMIGSVNDRETKADSDYVWALRNITFDVEQGDVLGIIGKNGAGKSTLLKILSKVTAPTTGTIKAKGRIASLLEIGTGFHPELTGRENIFMNGAIMGMTKAEINRKFDEIVDFSGVERYIDTPVKRYSSGMSVRLGFAVAAFLEPEILVVDEVLAVGDAEFQKKAIGKMKDVSRGDGRTVLFVSHNMGSMQQLCTKGMLLDKGGIAFTGTIGETIQQYQRDVPKRQHYEGIPAEKDILQLLRVQLSSSDNDVFYPSSEIFISFVVKIIESVANLVIGFNVYSVFGHPLARADYNDLNNITSLETGVYKFDFKIPAFTFSSGEYIVVLDVAQANVRNYAPESSKLSFEVVVDESHFGNVFNESAIFKSSIIRSKWLVGYEKLR